MTPRKVRFSKSKTTFNLSHQWRTVCILTLSASGRHGCAPWRAQRALWSRRHGVTSRPFPATGNFGAEWHLRPALGLIPFNPHGRHCVGRASSNSGLIKGRTWWHYTYVRACDTAQNAHTSKRFRVWNRASARKVQTKCRSRVKINDLLISIARVFTIQKWGVGHNTKGEIQVAGC